jgi:hypothetical protein
MAVGDAAAAKGMSLVAATDMAKNGHTEINRSRDYIAGVIDTVPTWKMTYGTSNPNNANGANGDIYFKYIP